MGSNHTLRPSEGGTVTRAAPCRAPSEDVSGVQEHMSKARGAFVHGRRVGPWQTFACDLPVSSIRPKKDFRRQQSNSGNDVERSLPIGQCMSQLGGKQTGVCL